MKTFLISVMVFFAAKAHGQDIHVVLEKAKAKIDRVNDYSATGKLKTNVSFLKVPVANVQVYFKKPDRLQVVSERGISFIPKGAVNINLKSSLNGKFTVIDAGTDVINGHTVRVAKLLPEDENSNVVLSTLYIDDAASLILKARTTTKDNGTYELALTYGKYAAFGLPDRVLFSFDTKDYRLPKGVTFDFDTGSGRPPTDVKNRKGRAEIDFNSYVVNRGVSDAVFK